jgi:hypothetical protein
MGNSSSAKPMKLGDARVVVTSGAGESETNGVYVEMQRPWVSNKGGKPSFKYAGRTRGHAAIVMWWTDAGEQWTIGKFPCTADVASTTKHLYIASAATGADVTGLLPPSTGWAVSAKANHRAMGGPAKFTIDPAPRCLALGTTEPIPSDSLQEMFKRGVEYAADDE